MALTNILDCPQALNPAEKALWIFLVEELCENGRVDDTWAWSHLLWCILNKDW
jgi:hypothetical protein